MDSYSDILKSLRREAVSVRGRLQSIIADQRYVLQFQPFALVANERCGLWYVTPALRADTVYFKSTDGHTGEWRFSERRTNLHLLDLVAAERTVVVVDSTRKGKLLPDALLKTIPIWCAVLNYVMFAGEPVPAQFADVAAHNWLATPREMVLASEHAAIAGRIPQFAADAVRLGLLLQTQLRLRLGALQPVLPCWMWPGKRGGVSVDASHFSICCASASAARAAPAGWPGTWPYVQGAGDDHELWAGELCGGAFDADVFWTEVCAEKRGHMRVVDEEGNICQWLSEEELAARVEHIHRGAGRAGAALDVSQLGDTGIYLGQIKEDLALERLAAAVPGVSEVVVLSAKYVVEREKAGEAGRNVERETVERETVETEMEGRELAGSNLRGDLAKRSASNQDESSGTETQATPLQDTKAISLHIFNVESSKKGSKQLRTILPAAAAASPQTNAPVVVLCDTGKDLGVGVALCILCRHYTSAWDAASSPTVNKDVIKQHLNRILEHRKINPSRNTLQSVNTFLMGK